VASFIRATLARQGTVVEEGPYDAVVVNGEGSMHHGSPGFHKKMQLLREALDAGKPAHLVNTVWQSNPRDYDAVLPRLSSIIVREPFSQADLKANHGIDASLSIDFSVFAPVDPAPPAADFKGGHAASDFYSEEFAAFVRVTGGALGKTPYLDMRRMTWSGCVASLKTASVFICGRHHGIYAACKARVPFVPFRGNTHKVEGIFRLAGVEIPLCASPAELPARIEQALSDRTPYEALFDWMDRQTPWPGITP
jgi:hypothetical protein